MRMLLLLAAFVSLAFSQGSQVGDFWVINQITGCDYIIQVNEDGEVLTSIEGRVSGKVGSFSIWGSGQENVCITNSCAVLAGKCEEILDGIIKSEQ